MHVRRTMEYLVLLFGDVWPGCQEVKNHFTDDITLIIIIPPILCYTRIVIPDQKKKSTQKVDNMYVP